MSTIYKIVLILSLIAAAAVLYFSNDLGGFFGPLCSITFIIAGTAIVVGFNKLLEIRFYDTRKTHEELIEDAQIYDEYSYTADPMEYDELEQFDDEPSVENNSAWVDALFKEGGNFETKL